MRNILFNVFLSNILYIKYLIIHFREYIKIAKGGFYTRERERRAAPRSRAPSNKTSFSLYALPGFRIQRLMLESQHFQGKISLSLFIICTTRNPDMTSAVHKSKTDLHDLKQAHKLQRCILSTWNAFAMPDQAQPFHLF